MLYTTFLIVPLVLGTINVAAWPQRSSAAGNDGDSTNTATNTGPTGGTGTNTATSTGSTSTSGASTGTGGTNARLTYYIGGGAL